MASAAVAAKRRRTAWRAAVVAVALLAGFVALDLALPALRPEAFDDRALAEPPEVVRLEVDKLQARLGAASGFPVPPRVPGTFAAGVFGGSVAHRFAQGIRPRWKDVAAARALAGALGREPRLVDLALSGSAQPSQLVLVTLAAPALDAVVVLDGFNELFSDGPACDAARDALARGVDAGTLAAPVHARVERLHGLVASPLWRVAEHTNSSRFWLFSTLRSLQLDLEGRFRTLDGTLAVPAPAGDPLARRVAHWEACVALSDAAARAAGVPAWFFVQPNQYVPGSKPIGPAEAAVALREPSARGPEGAVYARVGEAYALFDAAVGRLRARGIRAESLANVFVSVEEPLYVDDCCHVGGEGNRLLAEAVFARLAGELAAGR